jgi:hypothetical protein
MSLVTRGMGVTSVNETSPTLPPIITGGEVGELFMYNENVEPDILAENKIEPPVINIPPGKKEMVPKIK